jgi:hypothetical protein
MDHNKQLRGSGKKKKEKKNQPTHKRAKEQTKIGKHIACCIVAMGKKKKKGKIGWCKGHSEFSSTKQRIKSKEMRQKRYQKIEEPENQTRTERKKKRKTE